MNAILTTALLTICPFSPLIQYLQNKDIEKKMIEIVKNFFPVNLVTKKI